MVGVAANLVFRAISGSAAGPIAAPASEPHWFISAMRPAPQTLLISLASKVR